MAASPETGPLFEAGLFLWKEERNGEGASEVDLDVDLLSVPAFGGL